MVQLLGIFAVWITWQFIDLFIETNRWMGYLAMVVLGIGYELLEEPSTWYYGVGIGGGAAILVMLTDLLTVATDSGKLSVLRRSRDRRL